MNKPQPGDRIEMPSMGDDVNIEVHMVPDEQPRCAEGIFTIVDQYHDRHEVELDGDVWTTVPTTL